MKRLVWTLLALGFVSVAARADDDAAIYGPDIPADAAFVRVIDALGTPDLAVTVDGTAASTGLSGATGYTVVTSGEIEITSGENVAVVPVTAGTVYSIAVSGVAGAVPTVFEDAIAEDPSKATIALYNLSGEPVSIAALAERVTVIEPVAAEASALRAVNAVVIDLYLEGSAATIENFPQFALQAKTIASFFVFGDSVTVRVTNSVERTQS
ncbi:alginate O-acetyltransferase AlgF [Devosia psychrophila]|uniref:Alginate biosynthesis protein AlgF n=1 Tax=Devosia psychrophila TaxID=728005 RepID=A0A0F5PZ45_9HYPH|nr:alginate O-acetyltransferase AlgF [Devosia psychrophila]KKC33952.1 hypothetical protein WH91_05700 [Devosia psychrophila]SFD18033.1 Alginate O-acetyl transferase AlgF [Devosia psychrophila]